MASIPSTAHHWLLKRPPTGQEKDLFELFELSEQPLYSSKDEPEGEGGMQGSKASGKVLVKTKFISNDPTQRGWMRSDNTRSYIKPVQPGQVMRAWGIGQVIESFSPKFSKNDFVFGFLNWSTYNIFDDPGTEWPRGLIKLPKDIRHPEDYFSALSVTALAAHTGLFQIGQPNPNNDHTIVISGAAGATGSLVVQIAKKVLNFRKVIGIAGGEDKCKIVKDVLGADFALDYKSPSFKQDFKSALGDKTIDIYFDNVGGEILDLCLRNMSKYGRVVACGAISVYNEVVADLRSEKKGISPGAWINIVTHSLTVKGFILSDYNDKIEEAGRDLYRWYTEGRIEPLKTVWKAKFEEVPRGLEKLFKGDNVGKLVTELVD